ncbi:extracellular solute-binding protein [Agromyces atrinae]|uniref:extracellular solute-binding protein n=1 Tax=Agromyces atrinae TaxID=592376 RepID=UPI001F58ADF8|nr:extracellular solute-binding protein [Agromyces atrinae]MCI2956712.1 extracellular solute-binding protein [Agromyces atrinae]
MKNTTRLGVVAGLVAVTLALTGCGRADDTGEGPAAAGTIGDGPATGTLTMWAMGTEGELLPDFVAAFEEANPDVSIEVTAIPWDAAYNKFQTAIAAGNTPDIAMVGSTWMADFTDAFSTVPTDLDTSDFFPGSMSTNEVGDRVAGVPWYVDTRVLYYRTDLAAQAGWDKAPETWDELKQLAADYQSKAGADFGMRLPAGNDSFQGTLWMPWSNGAELTDGDAWTLDTPEMVEAYEYYQSFFTEGLSDPDADVSAGAQEAAFVDGSTPMLIDGPFMRSQLATLGGDGFDEKYATAVIPAKESSVSFSGGANLVVFNNGDNQTSAWKLAQWLSQPETQVDWYETSGDLPSAQSAWKDPSIADDASLTTFGTQLETAKATPVTTTWVQVGAAADQALELLRRGQATVEEALADLQAKADSIGMG